MRMALRMKFFVTSKTSIGKVADSRTTFEEEGLPLLCRFSFIVAQRANLDLQLRAPLRDAEVQLYNRYLYVSGECSEDFVDLVFEPSTQHLIRLVQHEHFDALRTWNERSHDCDDGFGKRKQKKCVSATTAN